MQSGQKGSILIVDDEEIIRGSLSELLQKQGYHTDTAAYGAQGIERVVSGDFDLVLLDLKMPMMDGIEALKQIKMHKPKTKVIMLTAYTKTPGVVTAMKEGASDYIPKPYVQSDLLATVREVISEARAEDKANPRSKNHFDVMSHQIRRDIMRLLSSGSRRYTEIAMELKMSDHTKITFHLNELKKHGIVEQGTKAYFLTQRGRKMAELLILADIYFL